ncbi:MAG: hypothetical protein JXR60_04000 [Bacteroidales bacterium]|nr:hypothetical protein [Bacteroidales bacterium]
MKKYLLAIWLTWSITLSFSQVDTSFVSPPDTSDNGFDYFYTEEERSKYLNYKPIISVGTGVLKFYGDVRDVYGKSPIMGNTAVNLGISRDLNNFLTVHFNATYGNLSGLESSTDRNLNFKTEILNGALLLSYNFYHLLKKPDMLLEYKKQRKLIPEIAIGLSAFNFSSKADMKDAYGNTYHYWSDGTIRNLPENPQNETKSLVLQRDYSYETDLRELDLDGLGKYTKAAFAVPIDVSINYQLHERAMIKFGSTYYFVVNDNIDNVSPAGIDNRKGKSGGDNYLYTYASIKLDLFSNEKEVYEDATYYVSPEIIDALLAEDEDGDGVADIWDKCLETPKGIAVDDFGCPFDDDQDGFANYRDKELNTEKDSITNMEGVKLTPEEWQAYSDTSDAIAYYEICDYYPSMCYDHPSERYRNMFVKIPDKFINLDEDKDGYISIEEVSKAIDEFFNMTSSLTIDDIYELTEFFFSQ